MLEHLQLCGQEALDFCFLEKTIIKSEQTAVITAMFEVLRLTGAGCSWSGRNFQLALTQRTVMLGGPASHHNARQEKSHAKISITAGSSNQ